LIQKLGCFCTCYGLHYDPNAIRGAELSESSLIRSRLERDLARGDLRALSDIAFGRVHGPDFDQVDRLCERGFLAKTRKGRARMTLKGWVAILLRHTIAKSR